MVVLRLLKVAALLLLVSYATAARAPSQGVTSRALKQHGDHDMDHGGGHDMDHGGDHGGDDMGPAPDDCYETPTKSECRNYEYPEERGLRDLNMLCDAMPDMPGCSVRRACENNNVNSQSQACHYMTLLATICDHEMENMGGCRTYTVMCGDGSAIQQCNMHPRIRRIPTWGESRQAMFDMCDDHPMSQCEECNRNSCPDPLASLSGACLDMPNMPQCTQFERWCESNEDELSFYCGQGGGSSSGLPAMLMYFHKRIREIVLWTDWVPETRGEYAGTIIAIFCFGIVSIGTKTCVTLMGMYWKAQAPPSAAWSSMPWWIPRRHQWWQNAIKAVVLALSILLDYWNMLIAMTFNVGLFCSVVLGYALGAFFFASFPENYAMHLQMQSPPKVMVDCECPANFDKVTKEGAEDKQTLTGGNKSCCKASNQLHDNTEAEAYTSPACCPGLP